MSTEKAEEMAPNVTTVTGVLCEENLANAEKQKDKFVRKIVWLNVAIFVALHLAALYGLYLAFTSAKLLTSVYGKKNYK